MSYPCDLSIEGRRAISAHPPTSIFGGGYPSAPTLGFQLQLDYENPFTDSDCGFEVTEAICRLSPFDQQWISVSRRARINVLLFKPNRELPNQLLNLEFPMDRERIAFIERERKGKNIRLRLDFEISANRLVMIGETEAKFPRPLWALLERPEWKTQRETAAANGRTTRGEIQNAILDDITSALQRLVPEHNC